MSEARLTPLELLPWTQCAQAALGSNDPHLWAKEQRWHDEIPWADRRTFWTTQGMKSMPQPTERDPVPGPWRRWLEEMKRHPCEETGEEHVTRWMWWPHCWGHLTPPDAFIEAIAELAPLGWLDAHPDTGHSPALKLYTVSQAVTWMRHLSAVPAWQPGHLDRSGDQLWATWLMRVALEREGGEQNEAMAVAAWDLDFPRDGQAHGQSLWSWLAHSELMGSAWKARNGEPPSVPPADQARAALMNQKLSLDVLHTRLDELGEAIWDPLPGRRPLAEAWLTQARLEGLSEGERVRFWNRRGDVLVPHGWHGQRQPDGLHQWTGVASVEGGVPSLIQEKNLLRWVKVVAALIQDEHGALRAPFPEFTAKVAHNVAKGVLGLHHLDRQFPSDQGSRLDGVDQQWQVAHWPPIAVKAVAEAFHEAWINPDAQAKACALEAQQHWEHWVLRAQASERQHHSLDQSPTQARRRPRPRS